MQDSIPGRRELSSFFLMLSVSNFECSLCLNDRHFTYFVSFHPHSNSWKLGEWVSSLPGEVQRQQCPNLMVFYKYELWGYNCVPVSVCGSATY